MVFMIDNMAVLYGWYKGHVSNDESASKVLKCVHYLSRMLGTTVNVEYVDRVSTEMAKLADELSRKAVSGNPEAREALERVGHSAVCAHLLRWLKDPMGEKNLCQMLVNELLVKCP